MTKDQFIDKLMKQFSSVSPEEQGRMAEYYSEIINDKIDEGKSEEQAVSELDSPEDIFKNYLNETSDTSTEFSEKKSNVGAIVGFTVLIPFVILLVVILGVVALSFVLSSAAIILYEICIFISGFMLFAQSFTVALFQLGAGLFFMAVGGFALFGSIAFTKLCIKIFKSIFNKYVSVYGGANK